MSLYSYRTIIFSFRIAGFKQQSKNIKNNVKSLQTINDKFVIHMENE